MDGIARNVYKKAVPVQIAIGNSSYTNKND